jgi:hypothetical protein
MLYRKAFNKDLVLSNTTTETSTIGKYLLLEDKQKEIQRNKSYYNKALEIANKYKSSPNKIILVNIEKESKNKNES